MPAASARSLFFQAEQANDIAQPIDVVCSIEARARKIDGFEFVSHLGGDPEHPGQQDSNQQEYAFHKLSLLWLVVICRIPRRVAGAGLAPCPLPLILLEKQSVYVCCDYYRHIRTVR